MRWTLTVVLLAVFGSAYVLENYRRTPTPDGRIEFSASTRGMVADSAPAAPSWKNSTWLNTPAAISLESLKGRVVLLNFWVFTCGNCTNTVPSLREFDDHYRASGLSVLGIHTPEFPPYAGEHDKNNVAKALMKYAIAYPVALDNDRASWDLYRIHYWPSFVLIDKKGHVRYEGYGEFHVGDRWHTEWERRIKTLLAE